MTETSKSSPSATIIVLAVMAVAGVLSGFFAINEYAKGTGALVRSADRNADRFEMVFRDLVQARFRAMNLAADVMLQSRVTVEAFAKNDRASLVNRIEPFYNDVLVPEHGVAQMNFWQPPAKLYYRAGEPKSFGQDLGTFRKSIVAANDRRQRISAIETGAGGVIAIRAIVPVMVEDKHVGVVEFATGFDIPLERAAAATGLQWAVGLKKEVSERVERPTEIKTDAWKGNDVFYLFADHATGELVRDMDFDPRAMAYTLGKAGSRTTFVKTFQVLNYAGVPTIVVANVLDLTDGFAAVLRSVAIETLVVFLILSVVGSVGIIKFGRIKEGLTRMLSKQRAELEEREAACDIAVTRLREVDVIKRGFFTNVVASITDPLQAIAGQLLSLLPTVERMAKGEAPDPAAAAALRGRFSFALSETGRLSHLTEDYQQLRRFHERLVQAEAAPLSMAEVVSRAVNEDLAPYRRLPQLSITAAVPADLPTTRADAEMLRRAVSGLMGYAAQRGGRGRIHLTGRVDEAGWLEVSIAGSAFAAAGQPDEALLDESRQFLARVNPAATDTGTGVPLVGVVLSRAIIEYYGGSLEASPHGNDPGFVVRLPVAA